jgi:hypothetical protein
MQPNPFGPGPVKEERRSGFQDVIPQLLSSVAFGEDVLREALGAVAAILFLHNLENQFLHTFIIRHRVRCTAGLLPESRYRNWNGAFGRFQQPTRCYTFVGAPFAISQFKQRKLCFRAPVLAIENILL